jgi:hypothetical protein
MGIVYSLVARENQEIISFFYYIFIKQDKSALVYITKEELKSFKSRADIKE